MTVTGATTGARLKAERERRGLSSQKAADELHLDGWVIDALEADDYERIGPSVYAKGHLKRYAALLGLPPAEIMDGYESRAQAPRPPASQPTNVRLRTDAPAVSNLPWPSIVGSIAVVLLVAGVVWWKPWQHRGAGPVAAETLAAAPSAASTDRAPEPAGAVVASADASPAVSSAAALPPMAAPSPAPSSAPSVPPAGAAAPHAARATPSPEPDATAGIGRARLRLSFSADSWVDVHDAAGRRVFAGNGRANSVKTIAGIAPMRVYLGFASGVQLEINNRAIAIGPQFMAGDVARFEAGADGVLRRDTRSAATPALATPGVAAPGAPTRSTHPSG
ncbi:MAG TPA: helix-turn-helix domain-containing protein [Steroidobacteraceae bacterium]